jgi:hypothetical protein
MGGNSQKSAAGGNAPKSAVGQFLVDSESGGKRLVPEPRSTGLESPSMAAYVALTDAEWRQIEPHLPVNKAGRQQRHDRETVAAFLFARAAG